MFAVLPRPRSAVRILLAVLLAGSATVASAHPSPTHAAAQTITVATVNNPDMVIMEQLVPKYFTPKYHIAVKFVTLSDQVLRQKITQDVALGAGQLDVVTLGNDEIQAEWARNKWLSPLTPMFAALRAQERTTYDVNDLIKPIRASLSWHGTLYALPFYGESNFTMYRTDLFAAHHLTMPAHPKWSQIERFAKTLHDPAHGVYGICMKGTPEYGQLAPLITFANSFGARFFDMHWVPQLTSPAWERALSTYVYIVRHYGEPGASSFGFNECLGLMAQGKAGIWVDATVAAGFLNNPKTSKVAGKLGYVPAPYEVTTAGSHWLYSWALGIDAGSKHKDAAFQFMRWATSKAYIQLVAQTHGWVQVPPGTRYSTYANPHYQATAKGFYRQVLEAINTADMLHPTMQPVPYTGLTQVDIPQYASWAFELAQDYSAAVAGQLTPHEALAKAQAKAYAVMKAAGYIK